MTLNEQQIKAIVDKIVGEINGSEGDIPVGVSNRHIHLSREHVDILFGEGYKLTPIKDLSQPGQYACRELLTIVGPSMRPIENVRVLGPERSKSQVEISATDSYVLKVKPPVRESGNIKGSSPIRIIEGSYTHHPELMKYYDFRVFLDTPPTLQWERILKREGETRAEAFRERWIPLEEKYLSAHSVKEHADLVITLD